MIALPPTTGLASPEPAFPFVVTPACVFPALVGVPLYWPEVAATGWVPLDGGFSRVVALPLAREPEPTAPDTTVAMADSPVAACRPVPFGFHCDWPSEREGTSVPAAEPGR